MQAKTLGINGLGRIGKLTLWYHLAHDDFDTIVVNVGRPVGTSLQSILEYVGKDSTYGQLHKWLAGCDGRRSLEVVDERVGLCQIHRKTVIFLREARDPKDIPWREFLCPQVIDCTGKFRDPYAEANDPKGSLRGHLAAGARAVIISSPFKSKEKGPLPDDTAVLIHGINHFDYDPRVHKIVSAASCTTTGLAHMMRPLLAHDLTHDMITAGMSTIHAVTNSQPLLDAVPGSGATDLRKTRSGMNNIVITSTNAAKALEQVMPEIARIGFMADSVRIPTDAVSLIVLNVTFQTEERLDGTVAIDKEAINAIYAEAAASGESKGLLKFSMEQNVSRDMLGEDAAVTIEGVETHTRTGFVNVRVADNVHRIPVTHVKIFGWYDNEMGSYTHRLGELTTHVARFL